MQKQINFIEDLSSSDLDRLARLLSFHPAAAAAAAADADADAAPFPPTSWLAAQGAALSSFPAHLLRPTGLLPRLARRLPFGPPKAVLCGAHQPLNPPLARRLFMQLCAEAGPRVQRLVDAAGGAVAGETGEGETAMDMDPAARAWLRGLTALNGLWMAPDAYRAAPPEEEEPRFERVASGCMACVLAIAGGSAQAVQDLRTSLLGRRRRGREPRLWGLVEAWTANRRDAEEIRTESERLGRLVRRERRRIRRRRRRRRERRRERRNGELARSEGEGEGESAPARGGDGADDDFFDDDEPGDAIGDFAPRGEQGHRDEDERDFEGSIIDFYRAAAGVDEDLHPVFRNSVAYDPTSGTFSPRQQQLSTSPRAGDRAGAMSRRTFYSQSAYSQDAGLDSDTGGSTSTQSHVQGQGTPSPAVWNPFVDTSPSHTARDKHVAEKRAESYRKLVGIPEEHPAARAPPSEAAMRECMRGLWEPQPEGTDAEEDEVAEREEAARAARVQKALADAYGDRSKTNDENIETRANRLTTWSGMMKKGGAKN